MLDLLLASITLSFLFFAALYDIKTKEVPNWLTWGFIIFAGAAGFVARLFDWSALLFFALYGALFYILVLWLYQNKFWGGADSKILLGIALMHANPLPAFIVSFMLILIACVLVISAYMRFTKRPGPALMPFFVLCYILTHILFVIA